MNGTGQQPIGTSITTYLAGTNTPATTYSDAGLTIPNDNPILLQSSSEILIYGTGPFRLVIRDGYTGIGYDIDNVSFS